jgi:uncharacterized membrane protein
MNYIHRFSQSFYRHSLAWLFGLLLIWVLLPWLAPLFMYLGWDPLAKVIYSVYSFQCHQLPQRSFFLFGQRGTYSLGHIQSTWRATNDPLILRQFIGNATMGYKVAWSDRMISAYSSIPLAGLLFWPIRNKLKKLSIVGFILLSLPMAIDGGTHMLSDMAGIGQGFRYTNEWLAQLTNSSMSAAFYTGTTWGSFNSLMRLLTGIMFGLGLAWFILPRLTQNSTNDYKMISSQAEEASTGG